MSLERVQEQTIRNTLTGGDLLLYELSIAGKKILVTEMPLQIIKNDVDFSINPAYPPARAGEIYVAAQAGEVGQTGGTFGTGKFLAEKDILLCITNNNGGDEAAVGASWIVIASNGSSGSTARSLSQIDQTPEIAGMTYGTITGAVDGINDIFVTSKNNYIPGKIIVVYRGATMFQKIDFEELDPATGKIKFLFIPIAGSSLIFFYAYKDFRLGSFGDSFGGSFDS